MNSKEALKIQAAINILEHEAKKTETINNLDGLVQLFDNRIYEYWWKLGNSARLLSEIIEEARNK